MSVSFSIYKNVRRKDRVMTKKKKRSIHIYSKYSLLPLALSWIAASRQKMNEWMNDHMEDKQSGKQESVG